MSIRSSFSYVCFMFCEQFMLYLMADTSCFIFSDRSYFKKAKKVSLVYPIIHMETQVDTWKLYFGFNQVISVYNNLSVISPLIYLNITTCRHVKCSCGMLSSFGVILILRLGCAHLYSVFNCLTCLCLTVCVKRRSLKYVLS